MSTEDTVTYDVEEAAAQVAERTGKPLKLVEEILEAEFLFNAAAGFYEIPDDEEGQEFMAEVEQLQKDHADLLPKPDEEIEDYDDIEDRLVSFVARLSGAKPEVIGEVLDEHILYLEEKGILEPVEEED
jgi:hypothetical protein